MRRSLLSALYALAGLGLLGALCVLLGLGELRNALSRAAPGSLAAFLVLSVAVFCTYAARWQIVLRGIGSEAPSLLHLLFCRASGHAAATLLPSAQLSGEPVRVVLLRRFGLDWRSAVLAVALDRLLEMTAGVVFGPLYVSAFLWTTGASPAAARWLLAGMAAGFVGLALLWLNAARGGRVTAVLSRRGWLPSLEETAARVAGFVRSRQFIAALGLSFLVELLLLAELRVLTRAFGIELSLATIGAALVGMGLSHLAPIPGALGSLEAAQVGVVRLAGGTASLGLALGLLIRLRETLWVLVGAVYLWTQGFPVRSGNTSAIEAKGPRAKRR